MNIIIYSYWRFSRTRKNVFPCVRRPRFRVKISKTGTADTGALIRRTNNNVRRYSKLYFCSVGRRRKSPSGATTTATTHTYTAKICPVVRPSSSNHHHVYKSPRRFSIGTFGDAAATDSTERRHAAGPVIRADTRRCWHECFHGTNRE